MTAGAGTRRDSRRDHANGSVTFEFLLALPMLATFVTVIVQVMVLLHARTIVDHAAFAAARSAAVWYPRSSGITPTTVLDGSGDEPQVRIHHAAALACFPISVNFGDSGLPADALPSLGMVGLASGPFAGASQVLAGPGKLAYASRATTVTLEVVNLGGTRDTPFHGIKTTVRYDLSLFVPVANLIFGHDPAPPGYGAAARRFTRIVSSYVVPLEEEVHARVAR